MTEKKYYIAIGHGPFRTVVPRLHEFRHKNVIDYISTGQGPYEPVVYHHHESKNHNIIDWISDKPFVGQEEAFRAAKEWLTKKLNGDIPPDGKELVHTWALNTVLQWVERGTLQPSQAAVEWVEKSHEELGIPASAEELASMLRVAFEAGRVYEELASKGQEPR